MYIITYNHQFPRNCSLRAGTGDITRNKFNRRHHPLKEIQETPSRELTASLPLETWWLPSLKLTFSPLNNGRAADGRFLTPPCFFSEARGMPFHRDLHLPLRFFSGTSFQYKNPQFQDPNICRSLFGSLLKLRSCSSLSSA